MLTSICAAGKAPFPFPAIPSPQNITADTSNQVGRRLLWLGKAWVSVYPDSTGWQGDAMPFISSTNIYLENKRQALGHMHFSFLPRHICLPNKGCFPCPYALRCLWCLRPSWLPQPQPLREAAIFFALARPNGFILKHLSWGISKDDGDQKAEKGKCSNYPKKKPTERITDPSL